MSRARNLADMSSSLASGGFTGAKNYIINSLFDVWQRGNSFTSAGRTVDMWATDIRQGTLSVGRADTASYYPTFPSKYFANLSFGAQTYAADSVERGIFFDHWIENGFANLRGKTVTLTIYADTNQDFAVGFGNVDSTASQGGTSPSWRKMAAKKFTAVAGVQKYVYTFTLPSLILGSDAYRDHMLMWLCFGCNQYYSNAGFGSGNITAFNTTGSYFNLLAVQLEEGSVSTNLERRLPGAELDLCQRFCFVKSAALGDINWGDGRWEGDLAYITIQYPVQMRAAPSWSAPNVAGLQAVYPQTAWYNVTGLNGVHKNGVSSANLTFATAAAGAVPGKMFAQVAVNSGATALLIASSEL